MKLKLTFLLCIVFILQSCSLFRSSEQALSCPARTKIIGAEKLLTVGDELSKSTKNPNVTEGGAKTDPVTGKRTSRKKGLRTGEIEKKPKEVNTSPYVSNKEKEKDHLRITDKERKRIIKQMKKDEKDFGKETVY